MRSAFTWLLGAAAAGSLLFAPSPGETAQRTASWSITVGQSPTTFPCGQTALPVPAADSCAAAITAAQSVFNASAACAPPCPRSSPVPGTPSCTVKAADLTQPQRFVVSIPYTCAPAATPEPTCDEAAELKDGEPVLPEGATDVQSPGVVQQDRGLLSQLYPGKDVTAGLYPLGCEPSIGGALPPEVEATPTKDELAAEESLADFEATKGEEIAKSLGPKSLRSFPPLAAVKTGGCFIKGKQGQTPVPCDSPLFLRPDQPFEGRDIVYVHGLAIEHLTKHLAGNKEAWNRWPEAAAEFLDDGGYFREYAENYWHDHIRENLFDPDDPASKIAGWQWTAADAAPRYNPKSNRYLIVAWSANQTIEFAQHTLLTQIQLAMASGKNVVTPPSYPATYVRPFCSNGCVVIAHSAGALVTSSALGRASVGHFGPGGEQVVQRIRAHVSFEGAISGSRLASIGVLIGMAASGAMGGAPHGLCNIFNNMLGVTDTCIGDTAFLVKSVLRDLMPVVAQVAWGRWVDRSPVPTVTVAGGHALGNFLGLTKFMLPGLDDGVVSMNSACGNPNPVYPLLLAPSGSTVKSLAGAFDFSEDAGLLARAALNYRSHLNYRGGLPPGVPYFASACTPYRSPTGMVMPVWLTYANTPWDAHKRYRNHYSFLQGSIDHSYDGGGDDDNKWPSAMGAPASAPRHYLRSFADNVEETSAVTDLAIFAKGPDGTHLVHPSFNNMHEVVRGHPIHFNWLGKPRVKWLWKRTYHLLDKWESKQSSHYVYEFVLRR